MGLGCLLSLFIRRHYFILTHVQPRERLNKVYREKSLLQITLMLWELMLPSTFLHLMPIIAPLSVQSFLIKQLQWSFQWHFSPQIQDFFSSLWICLLLLSLNIFLPLEYFTSSTVKCIFFNFFLCLYKYIHTHTHSFSNENWALLYLSHDMLLLLNTKS